MRKAYLVEADGTAGGKAREHSHHAYVRLQWHTVHQPPCDHLTACSSMACSLQERTQTVVAQITLHDGVLSECGFRVGLRRDVGERGAIFAGSSGVCRIWSEAWGDPSNSQLSGRLPGPSMH